MPTARSRAAASPPTSSFRAALGDDVGGFQDLVALDIARQHGGFHGLDRGAGEAQSGRRGVGLVADFEADVEAAAARLVARRDRLQRAGVGGVELHVLHVAVEGQAEVGGVAETAAVLQRARDLKRDVLALERARQPRHRDRLDVPGVDADHLMRLQGGDHLRRRQRAGGAEIGRAIDRDLCRGAGIVDDVADPHQVAGDGDVGAQHRDRQ